MDIGLYIHIPFCMHKCAYCDFASFPGMLQSADAYIEALSLELRAQAERFGACRAATVFVGGGTPTLLTGAQLGRLLDAARASFPFAPGTEITLEGNPGTLTRENLHAYREAGVNRLSLGMQAAQDVLLERLGRIHRMPDVVAGVRMAREAGFDNLNLDLMYGLPGQTRADWAQTLRAALDLAPEHLSCYALIVEDGTRLALALREGRMPPVPGEDDERAMYDAAIQATRAAGLAQYELSNFARPGRACRHNLTYWECRPYLGVGLAAHSYMGGRRFGNTASMGAYMTCMRERRGTAQEDEAIGEDERMFERVMLGLRLTRGVDGARFQTDFGLTLSQRFGEPLARMVRAGLLEWDGPFLRLTRRGMDVQNAVLVELM